MGDASHSSHIEYIVFIGITEYIGIVFMVFWNSVYIVLLEFVCIECIGVVFIVMWNSVYLVIVGIRTHPILPI